MGRYMAKPAGSEPSSKDAPRKIDEETINKIRKMTEAIPVDGSTYGLSGECGEGWLYRKLWSFQKDSITA